VTCSQDRSTPRSLRPSSRLRIFRVLGLARQHVRAHGLFPEPEMFDIAPRTLISWSESLSIAQGFAGSNGTVYSIRVDSSAVLAQTLPHRPNLSTSCKTWRSARNLPSSRNFGGRMMIRDIAIDGRLVTYASLAEMDYDQLDRLITPYAADRMRRSTNLRHWWAHVFEGRPPLHFILQFPSAEEAQAADAEVAGGATIRIRPSRPRFLRVLARFSVLNAAGAVLA